MQFDIITQVLAYSNIFSYYSIDTEHMKTMDYYSQVLENGALLIQGKIGIGIELINGGLKFFIY